MVEVLGSEKTEKRKSAGMDSQIRELHYISNNYIESAGTMSI